MGSAAGALDGDDGAAGLAISADGGEGDGGWLFGLSPGVALLYRLRISRISMGVPSPCGGTGTICRILEHATPHRRDATLWG